jgi:cytochrome c553
MTLAVIGSIALLVGIFVAVLSIPRVVSAVHPSSNLPLQGALYIGTNTCFTCHGDKPLDWSATLYAQMVAVPSEKPQAIANLKAGEQVQQIDAGEIVDAYTTQDEDRAKTNSFQQNYVIQTEDGYVVHPSLRTTRETSLEDSFTKCSICHTQDSNRQGFDTVDLDGAPRSEKVTMTLVTIYRSGIDKDLF